MTDEREQTLCRRLALLPEGVQNVRTPTDMAYVFNHGFTPVIPQLLKHHLKQINSRSTASTRHDSFASGGDYATWFSVHADSSIHHTQLQCPSRSRRSARVSSSTPARILVVFVGGCAYAEVAALRLLGRQLNVHFVILTTSICGQRTFFTDLSD